MENAILVLYGDGGISHTSIKHPPSPRGFFLGRRFLGHRFLGRRFLGHCFLGRRFLGRRFLGRRFPGHRFLGRRFLGHRFLGRCFLGHRFLGLRSSFSRSSFSRHPTLASETTAQDVETRRRRESQLPTGKANYKDL